MTYKEILYKYLRTTTDNLHLSIFFEDVDNLTYFVVNLEKDKLIASESIDIDYENYEELAFEGLVNQLFDKATVQG